MAWTVPVAFDQLNSKLELTSRFEDLAHKRAKHIVDLLAAEFDIVEAFPSGSIPRGTAVSGLADLDVVVVLDDWEWQRTKPSTLLQRVRDTLGQSKTGVRKNGQAVTLHYKSWPTVDVVPAGQVLSASGQTNHLLIPNMRTERWIKSKPRLHSRTMENRESWCGYRFLDLIRMFKWWNYKHSKILQSFHIEVLALKALPWTLNEYTWPVFCFFDKGASLVSKPLRWEGEIIDSYLSATARTEAVKRMRAAASKASGAWFWTYGDRSEHALAIPLWQQIFPGRFPSYG